MSATYNQNHRLIRHEQTGVYRLQVQCVANPDPKMVAQKVTMSLKTKDVEEARLRRDLILAFLDKAQLLTNRIPLWLDEPEFSECLV